MLADPTPRLAPLGDRLQGALSSAFDKERNDVSLPDPPAQGLKIDQESDRKFRVCNRSSRSVSGLAG